MKTLLIGFTLLFLGLGESKAAEESGVSLSVCQLLHPKEAVRPQNSESKVSQPPIFRYLFKVLFAPTELVKMHKIENQIESIEGSQGLKIAFLTPMVVSLTDQENKSHRLFLKLKKKLNKRLDDLGFRDGVRKSQNFENCMTFILGRPQVEETLEALQDLIEQNQGLMDKYHDQNVSKEIHSKISFLERNNWLVIQGKNLNEIHSLIRSQKPKSVLILSHASEDGKLFDKDSNVFPVTFFHSLIDILDNLIIYSCYPEEVIKNYQIQKNSHEINYFYPVPDKKFSIFLGKNTPVIALKSIKHISMRSFLKDEAKKKCVFDLEQPLLNDFAFFLNGVFLASGSEKIPFSCNLLQESNRIEIYSTVKTNARGSINIFRILLKNKIIDLEEFVSKATNRHIVTKGSFIFKGDYDEVF